MNEEQWIEERLARFFQDRDSSISDEAEMRTLIRAALEYGKEVKAKEVTPPKTHSHAKTLKLKTYFKDEYQKTLPPNHQS